MKDRYFAFISYKSEDRPVADALLAALEQRGLACWMAPRNINTGADYGEQILQGIRDASVLVLVFSGRTNNSKYCPREVESAVRYGRRIFPIRIDSSVPNGSMEFQLSGVQWLEAQGESDWEKVAEQLAKAFDRTDTPIRTGPTSGPVKPYQFGGKEYYNTEQLTVALSENWNEGVKNFGRGFVSEWVKVDLRNFDLASRLLDIHENKELDPNEKLSVALVEMDPKLPGMWRGDVVNGEWASREPESFKTLLQSRIRSRLETQPGWPSELVKRVEGLRSHQLAPQHLAAVEQVIITGDPKLKIGDWEVSSKTLLNQPEKAVILLESPLPKFWAKETGETWLAEAASRWIDLWPQVDVLGCGTSKSAALPWIIGPAAALQERAGQLLQHYAGAKDERLDRLWSMDSLGTAECVVLCTAIKNGLLTPKAKILVNGLTHLKGFLVEADWKEVMDWEVAEQLLTANDWNAVQKRWEEVLSDVELNEHLKGNPKLRAVLESAQPEYLDVVAVCAIYGPTRVLLQACHRFEMQQVEEQKTEREVARRNRRNRIITGAVAVFTICITLLLNIVDADREAAMKQERRKAADEKTLADVKAANEKALADVKAANEKANANMMAAREKALAAAKAANEKIALAKERRLQWIGAAMRRTGFPEATIARALTRGGTVVAWGNNDKGQTTVPAGLSGVVGIAAGYSHTVALKSDGTVVAWGNNDYGQTKVPAGLSGVVAIATGGSHTVALKSDGTVVEWGNEFGSIKNLIRQTTVSAGPTSVIAIAAREKITVALKSDDTVVEWLGCNQGEITGFAELRGVVALASRLQRTVALKSNGTVVEWDHSYLKTKFTAGLSGVVGVAVGNLHTVALKSDGTVVEWDHRNRGGTTVPAGLSGVVAIATGGSHTVALKSDGTVVAWGNNQFGQTKDPAGLRGVVAIAAGERHTVALKLE